MDFLGDRRTSVDLTLSDVIDVAGVSVLSRFRLPNDWLFVLEGGEDGSLAAPLSWVAGSSALALKA